MSYNTTNLGNAASADILIGNTQVRSPNFSAPEQVVGSAASPSATLTQVYAAGITKYIFYTTITSGGTINSAYTITGMPSGFAASYSVVAQSLVVTTGAISVNPVISAVHLFTTGTTLSAQPIASTPPTFSGTGYLKVVIQLTLD
jgi:hypothetical protein